VIHRTSSGNILIAVGGVIKLTDFGIARSTARARLTGVGLAVGTLAYMCPSKSARPGGRLPISTRWAPCFTKWSPAITRSGGYEHAMMNAQLSVIRRAVRGECKVPQAVSAAHYARARQRAWLALPDGAGIPSALRDIGQAAFRHRRSQCHRAFWRDRRDDNGLADWSRSPGPSVHRRPAGCTAARRYNHDFEIRQALAGEIDDPKKKGSFLKTAPGVKTIPASPRPWLRAPTAGRRSIPNKLDRLAQALAPYLGRLQSSGLSRGQVGSERRGTPQTRWQPRSHPRETQRFLASVRSVF